MEIKFYAVKFIIDLETVTPQETEADFEWFCEELCYRNFRKDGVVRYDETLREVDKSNKSKGEFELIIPMYMRSPYKEDIEFQTKVIVDTQLHNEKACNRIKSYHIKDVSVEEIAGEYYDELLKRCEVREKINSFLGMPKEIKE